MASLALKQTVGDLHDSDLAAGFDSMAYQAIKAVADAKEAPDRW
ncbi:hypothetical protein [Paracoccus marcusii]